MSRRTRADREQLAAKRLRNVLRAHGVATDRTLEQKISDAGPFDQRIDPHVLTDVRRALVDQGEIIIVKRETGVPWYHLNTTSGREVQRRLDELQPIYARTTERRFTMRLGQALEIAIFRALQNLHDSVPGVQFFGGFRDLDTHDDEILYSKVEPEFISGRQSRHGLVDFALGAPQGTLAAIESKNLRQWVYPNRSEIKNLLRKALDLDAVPVLIARRLPFVTVHLLHPCGVLFHETYNQLYPAADEALADLVRRKDLLGYHDVRVGNQPDDRLTRFITARVLALLPDAQERFTRFRDLLQGYVDGEHSYSSFAARVPRRLRGEPEEGERAGDDEAPEGEDPWPDEEIGEDP